MQGGGEVLEWMRTITADGVEWLCAWCSRNNIRCIEAKLDTRYW